MKNLLNKILGKESPVLDETPTVNLTPFTHYYNRLALDASKLADEKYCGVITSIPKTEFAQLELAAQEASGYIPGARA